MADIAGVVILRFVASRIAAENSIPGSCFTGCEAVWSPAVDSANRDR